MSSDKSILFNREKKIKSKLVNTRKIIQNKFKRAFKSRVERERDLGKKYKSITNAIDKLAEGQQKPRFDVPEDVNRLSSDDDSDDHFMDVYDLTEYEEEELDPQSSKVSRKRSDDDSHEVKKTRKSTKQKISDPTQLKKLKQLESIRNIRDESKLPRKPKHKKRRRIHDSDDDDDGDDDDLTSEMAEEGDILIQPTGKGKKSCLDKPDLDEIANQARLKSNKKIREMRKADRILQEARSRRLPAIRYDQTSSESDNEVDMHEDSDSSSVIFVDEIPDRNPSHKRQVSSTYRQDKFVRQMPISLQRKYKTLKYPGTKGMPIPIVASLEKLRPRKPSKTPLYKIPTLPAIQRPYIPTLSNDYWERTMHPTKSYIRNAIEPAKPTSKGKKKNETVTSETKKGGKIEEDFIPYNEAIAYEFYDDSNELCDRLRLLIASRTAGNTNHSQEINSIIAELREANIIA